MSAVDFSEAGFVNFLNSLPPANYLDVHRIRFLETFRRARQFLERSTSVVELGQASPISQFLQRAGITVDTIETDLRLPYEAKRDQFDLILSLEVLEHLSDFHRSESAIGEIAMFTGNGARRMFEESWRILKPNGILVITTPNACSIDAIANILRWRHPFQYPPHVREYAPSDVERMASEAGFQLMENSTFFAWNSHPDIDRDDLIQRLYELDFDMSNRGNDAMYVFRK